MSSIGPFSIRFDQRKSDNTAYKEKYVSGSNLIVITNNIGEVTGSKTILSATITELSSSTANIVNIVADSGSFIKLFLNNSSSAPTNSTDAGTSGEIRIDDNFLYIYTNNVWTRIPRSRWS